MQLSEGKYSLLKQGNHSDILLIQKGQLQIVLKCVPTSSTRQVAHLLNQWSILKHLKHPNIIKAISLQKGLKLPNKQCNYFVLAQEFAPYGNLSEFIKQHPLQLTFPFRRYLLWELTKAISFLHSNNIVHRDLKLDNVLVSESQDELIIKLADFGFASTLKEGDKMVGSYKGTKRGYMAPEIHECQKQPQKQYDGKAADIFALGVILYGVVMGQLPFEFAVPNDRNYKLLIADNPQHFWSNLTQKLTILQQKDDSMTDEFKQLFEGMVGLNPKQRLTIEEVLQHPWMQGNKSSPQV